MQANLEARNPNSLAALRAAPMIRAAVAEMRASAYAKRQGLLAGLAKLRASPNKAALAANAEFDRLRAEYAAAKAALEQLNERIARAYALAIAASAARDQAIKRIEDELLETSDARLDWVVDYLGDLADRVRTSDEEVEKIAPARATLRRLRAEVWSWRTGDAGNADVAVPLRRVIEEAQQAVRDFTIHDVAVPDLES